MLGPCARSIGAEELHGLIELECEQEARPHGCGGLIRLEGVGVEMPEIDMQGTGHSSVIKNLGLASQAAAMDALEASEKQQMEAIKTQDLNWRQCFRVLRVQALGEIAVLESHTEEARAGHKSEMPSWEAG